MYRSKFIVHLHFAFLVAPTDFCAQCFTLDGKVEEGVLDGW